MQSGPVMLNISKQKQGLGPLLQAALDLLLPPRCIATGEIVDAPGTVSPSFWSQLAFIESPCCSTCGAPFAFEAPAGTICAGCMEAEPVFGRARSAVIYNDASRRLVIDFKYGDKLHFAKTFAPRMQRAGAELLATADIILPVPLSRRRLWQRRFNQSALLAQELGRRTGKTCLPDALLRLRHTVPQKGLSRARRTENVRNAFAVNQRHAGLLADRNLLLVDDVFTSGATLNECARTLKKAGARQVDVLTIARVVKEYL